MSGKEMKILLVDDEQDHVALIQRALADGAPMCELVIAHSLAEARRALQQDSPDIVICDYRLPDGTGMELLPGEAKQGRLPVVILTGKGDEALAVEALKAGAMDYVVKTNEAFADMPHIIERSMGQWQQMLARREAEELLRRAECIVSASADMLGLLDRKHVLRALNPSYAAALGKPADALVGRSLAEIHGEAFYDETIRPHVERCLAGEEVAFQAWIDFPGCGKRYMDFHFCPCGDAPVRIGGMVIDGRDITERKQFEQRIKRSEHRYRALFQLNPLMCFNLDAEGTITAVNQQGASQLGYTVDELTGQPVTVLFPGELHEKVHVQLQVCLGEPGRVFSWEITKVRKDGSKLWVNETASAIPAGNGEQQPSVLIMCEDITERKQARDRLASSEARYRALFQSVSDYAMLLKTQPSGMPHIVEANDAALKKHGYSREEMIGQPISIVDEWLEPARDAEIQRRLEGGEPVRFETRHRCKDGSIFDVEVSACKIPEKSGRLFYSVERDITERKAAEAQLHDHIQELERFQQATIDREFRIKELRDEIAALKARLREAGDATD